jgi:hypothetical protein
MTVVALNTNYVTTLNNFLLDPASPASAEQKKGGCFARAFGRA